MQEDPSVLFEHFDADLTQEDKFLMAAKGLKEKLLRSYAQAIRFGPEGWIEDDFGTDDWGFDPNTIKVPTLVWHGGRDTFSPRVNGEWLTENIPTAQNAFVPESSHFAASLEAVSSVLRWCR